jgi:4-hydroxy-tetrahydrodipicolinate synthase
MPLHDARTPAFAAGIWVPIVTPFSSGEVDHIATGRLVRNLCASGVHGLVVSGTTGEGPALTVYEKAALLGTVFEAAAADGVSVMLALEGANTAKLIDELREIGPWPVCGHLLPAPSYVRPSEEGLRRHFLAIAEAAGAPVMIYDIPARTGSTLSAALIAELAGTGRFPAIKACGLSAERLTELLGIPNLSVFCGDDSWILSALAQGAQGAVSASANVFPKEFAALYNACRENQFSNAEQIWERLLPATQLLFEEPNPAPVKAALALQGVIDDGLRLPLTPCSADVRQRLRSLLSKQDCLSDIDAVI